MITIDGNTYDVGIIKITRKASMKTDEIGTTMDLRKHYDVQGTYYDYDVEVATTHMNVAEYDSLYELVTQPVESHTVTLPYGQSTLTFEARTTVANDVFIRNFGGIKKWGKLKITFEALTPQREA